MNLKNNDSYYLFKANPRWVQFVHKTIPATGSRYIYLQALEDTVLHQVVMKCNAPDNNPQPYEVIMTSSYDTPFGLMIDSGYCSGAYNNGFYCHDLLIKAGFYLKLCSHAVYADGHTVGADIYYTGSLRLISDSGA